MEPSQFDEFTKSMATPTSRRKALKKLAIGTIGGLLTFTGLRSALAGEKKCPPGLTNCGGKCVDTKKDPNNCGTCGTKCQSGLCVNGLCCPPGAVKCGNSCCSFTCCGGNTCTNTQSDKNNCGSCGNVCPAGDICKNGTCVTPPPCQNNVCNGQTCFNITNGCQGNSNCYCYQVPDGTGGCGPSIPCAGAQTCTTCADCPSGHFCAINTCCGPQGICIPNCTQDAKPQQLKHGTSAHR